MTTIDGFIEATEFERLALDRYLPLIGEEPGDTWDFRQAMEGSGPICLQVHFVTEVSRRDDALRAALLPLVFGAAWKVLDLLLELAFSRAGRKPDQERGWSIKKKCRLAKQGAGDISLLGTEALTWQAIAQLYAETAEHRHCLVHRTASFSVSPLQLTGTSQAGALLPLDEQELYAFIHLAQLVADGVRNGGVSQRSVDHLHLCLRKLERHTGVKMEEGAPLQPPLNARIALELNSHGLWLADFAYLHEQLARRAPHQHVDVRIEIPGESGYELFGHVENIPQQTVTIDLSKLPDYLARR
ncbi:hypothetical protein [Vreelandella arctica]|uniref:hypothetical protein n=1 Tax=Vreelandella arctica TaxID=3126499 RepID=UPI00300E0EA1